MENLLTQIGMRILKRRKQLHMTQEHLAERAGVTPQTISAAELGKKALRPENIISICTALGISTDYLLLGRVTSQDQTILFQEITRLTPSQYRHLEDIVSSYIAALKEREV